MLAFFRAIERALVRVGWLWHDRRVRLVAKRCQQPGGTLGRDQIGHRDFVNMDIRSFFQQQAVIFGAGPHLVDVPCGHAGKSFTLEWGIVDDHIWPARVEREQPGEAVIGEHHAGDEAPHDFFIVASQDHQIDPASLCQSVNILDQPGLDEGMRDFRIDRGRGFDQPRILLLPEGLDPAIVAQRVEAREMRDFGRIDAKAVVWRSQKIGSLMVDFRPLRQVQFQQVRKESRAGPPGRDRKDELPGLILHHIPTTCRFLSLPIRWTSTGPCQATRLADRSL